ncbi:U4/U6.U5 tri-snRNP-associated protein 2 [Phytophthora fragariae]|uniref:U4/U6.U5 tri-snRNP-associated protein 2 n=1 Tax=Phytophthora fragariae TaxID=53985 RepID=A0A6G0SJI4_9STRA|nr:U4/U6.U5 tri-snRNP-associated protein 2 [Phytophthora fragariae]
MSATKKRKADTVADGDVSGAKRRKCPYLDTINHQLLDFDFEKVCSISLSDQNVYACLVCGKYFKGRGRNTHAFTHSVQSSHHVFINLQTDRIYCLPDNYEVVDNTLKPVQDALRPAFESAQIARLDQNRILAQDAFGVSYLPGFIGLNNLKHTDYINVVVQALAHVPPLRDFFLANAATTKKVKSKLVLRFGELLRKMWSPHNFKNTISPHELVQEVSVSSKKRFHVGTQNESVELLAWLLNELHRGLGGSHKPGSSIIHKCFQGFVEVTTDDETKATSADPAERESAVSTTVSPFLMMALDLPSTPLFKDSQGGNIIPQIPLFTVLEKYNGSHVTHVLQGSHRLKKTYRIDSLPAYLIFHVKRFTRNNFFIEKNPTIVNFPVKNMELRDYLKLDQSLPSEVELRNKSISELRDILRQHKQSTADCVEKADLVEKILRVTLLSTKYNLIANICHDSPVTTGQEAARQTNPLTEGSYRVHVQNRATEQWYEIQDLHVQETMPQLIGVSESYLMIYERKA